MCWPIGELPLVKNVSPEFNAGLPHRLGNKQSSHLVRGVAASYGVMRAERPQAGGRFLEEEDVRLRRRVAFIGTEVQAQAVRRHSGRSGETIRVGGQPFEIVGVMEEKVQLSNYKPARQVLRLHPVDDDGRAVGKPIRGHLRVAGRIADARAARSRAGPRVSRESGIATTRRTRGREHARVRGKPAVVSGIVGGLKLVMTFIGVLTLAIGGVGIMNIMFVNVQERTREIGVRKALGAKRHEILLQFLLEGLATTFAGGVVGIAVSGRPGLAAQPAPVSPELLDDASRVTDIQSPAVGELAPSRRRF